ncbi:MAG: hypothetical protein M3Y71_09215 [Actinomycetota bacterium]|nr:hypothetical protein [Actinomycetota bacterium]
MDSRQTARRSKQSSSPFRREPELPTPDWQVDERVTHDRHGLGRVVRINGSRMYVRFGDQTIDVDCRSPRIHPLADPG